MEKNKMKELTNSQLWRQDVVDNEIHSLIQKLAGNLHHIEWDIENIGDIRDVVEDVIVNRLKIMDAQKFYPFVEEK